MRKIPEVLLLMVFVVVGVGAVLLYRGLGEAIPSPSTPVGAAPAASATPVPGLPENAELRTPDDAVALAGEMTEAMGAQHPHLVSVQLMSVQDALIESRRRVGQPTENLDIMAGHRSMQPTDLVWAITFDGDTFGVMSCPAILNDQGTPRPCMRTKNVFIVLHPMRGATVTVAHYGKVE